MLPGIWPKVSLAVAFVPVTEVPDPDYQLPGYELPLLGFGPHARGFSQWPPRRCTFLCAEELENRYQQA